MTRILNYVPNPSAEGATASLENSIGTTVAIVSTTATGWPAAGTKSYSVTAASTALAEARLRLVDRAPAVAGVRWWARGKLRAASSNTGTRRVALTVLFYSVAPGATAGTVLGSAVVTQDLAPGAIGDFAVSLVAPTGALSAGVLVSRLAAALSPAAGDIVHVDQLQLGPWADAASTPAYTDGSQPNGFWNGTPDASTSYSPVLVPILTPHSDDAPSPRIDAYWPDLDPRMRFATVTRLVDDDVPQIVRDARMEPAAASFVVTDLEAPYGRQVTYILQMFDEVGASLGLTVAASTQIDGVSQLSVYIADPLDPGSVVKGIMSSNFAGDVGKTRDGSFATPGGSSSGSVLLAGASSGFTGLNLDFYTDSAAATRAFRNLRDQTPIAVLRFGPEVPLPGTLYVALLDPREVREDAEFSRWLWTSRQVRQPEASVIVPLRTYADYMAFFPTYSAAMSVFLTYVDSILNPPAGV